MVAMLTGKLQSAVGVGVVLLSRGGTPMMLSTDSELKISDELLSELMSSRVPGSGRWC